MVNGISTEEWTSWEALDEWLCERSEEAYINLGRVNRQQAALKMFEEIHDRNNQEAIHIVESYLTRLKLTSTENYTVEELTPLNLTITSNTNLISKELNESSSISLNVLSQKIINKSL